MEVKIVIGDKEFIIGKEYEFSDFPQDDESFKNQWDKGILTGYKNNISGEFPFLRGTKPYLYCREIEVKTPLFTTEDGVHIFERDKYYIVFYDFKVQEYNAKQDYIVWSESNYKKFSTKEKAEEYILLNKPCLSLTEISKFYKHLLNFNNGNSMGLRNLAKSKL